MTASAAETVSGARPLAARQVPAWVRVPRAYGLFALVCLSWLFSIAGVWLFNGLAVWAAGLLYIFYDTWLIAYVALRTRGVIEAQKAYAARPTPALRPTLSVVIAARNEESVLPACLDALLAQEDAAEEILLVDDGSTDGTQRLLRERYGLDTAGDGALAQSRWHPALRMLRKAHSGKARSLNEALRCVNGEVVFTLDADTIVAAGAVAGMRRGFALDPQLVAASGVLVPKCRASRSARFFEWFQTFEYIRAFLSRVAWARADALLLVSGAFAGYRREMLLRVGGFDPSCLVEDYELIHRLHRHAFEHGETWRVRVLAQAQATTDAPAALRPFLRQRRRWFAGFLQTQLRNRDMNGNPRYGAVGRFMLPVKTVDTLQPVYGLSAFVLLVWFLVSGRPVVGPILVVIAFKLIIDFAYHLWAVRLYHGWLGEPADRRALRRAALAALAEPFSFQLMRHAGAVLGWFSFLSGRLAWSAQRPVLAIGGEEPI